MSAIIDIVIGFIAAMVSAAFVHFGALDHKPRQALPQNVNGDHAPSAPAALEAPPAPETPEAPQAPTASAQWQADWQGSQIEAERAAKSAARTDAKAREHALKAHKVRVRATLR